MKTIIIALLISTLSFAQKEVKYSSYTPLITRHYIKDKLFAPNEGGRVGLIINRKVVREKYFTETSLGALENSYGKFSVALIQSVGKEIHGVSTSFGVGLTSGYTVLYDRNTKTRGMMPDILVDRGILPFVGVNLSLSKGLKISDDVSVSPLVIITPIFVNAGIKIMLK